MCASISQVSFNQRQVLAAVKRAFEREKKNRVRSPRFHARHTLQRFLSSNFIGSRLSRAPIKYHFGEGGKKARSRTRHANRARVVFAIGTVAGSPVHFVFSRYVFCNFVLTELSSLVLSSTRLSRYNSNFFRFHNSGKTHYLTLTCNSVNGARE